MRARCFPLLKGISLPLPSSADSWGCSLNDGKKQGLLHQPISNTQNIKNAGGGREERVGDEDQQRELGTLLSRLPSSELKSRSGAKE